MNVLLRSGRPHFSDVFTRYLDLTNDDIHVQYESEVSGPSGARDAKHSAFSLGHHGEIPSTVTRRDAYPERCVIFWNPPHVYCT